MKSLSEVKKSIKVTCYQYDESGAMCEYTIGGIEKCWQATPEQMATMLCEQEYTLCGWDKEDGKVTVRINAEVFSSGLDNDEDIPLGEWIDENFGQLDWIILMARVEYEAMESKRISSLVDEVQNTLKSCFK